MKALIRALLGSTKRETFEERMAREHPLSCFRPDYRFRGHLVGGHMERAASTGNRILPRNTSPASR